jgi:hypothetical protein
VRPSVPRGRKVNLEEVSEVDHPLPALSRRSHLAMAEPGKIREALM